MQIELENIGLIKEAKVNIDGLTVIAGENDTGKSTVGKVIYMIMPSINKTIINDYITELFYQDLTHNGTIKINYEDKYIKINIKDNNCTSIEDKNNIVNFLPIKSSLIIDSPYIWTIMPIIRSITIIESNKSNNIDFEIYQPLYELYSALNLKLKNNNNIKLNIKEIIGGQFQKDNFGDFSFNKNGQDIPLINTAMGIKYFGILQVLSDKNHFYNGQILILDEPEVHLHPKWQLELAKVIIELVKGGVKILVNSHSPYMIEALKRYSEIENLNNKTNFYLAQNSYIIQQDNLENIFEKLAIPMRELKNLKIKQYANN